MKANLAAKKKQVKIKSNNCKMLKPKRAYTKQGT